MDVRRPKIYIMEVLMQKELQGLEELGLSTKIDIGGVNLISAQQIARVHGIDTYDVTRAFNRHKREFSKGEHYYTFTREEFREMFPDQHCGGQEIFTNNKQKIVYFFTQKGYFNYVKILNTSVAWDMYKKIINNFFGIVELKKEELDKYIERMVGKEVRKNLSETIDESGENERMHNHGHSNYTLLLYSVCGLKERYLEYKKHNKDHNFRNTLSPKELKTVSAWESIIKSYIDLGDTYQEVKAKMNMTLAIDRERLKQLESR